MYTIYNIALIPKDHTAEYVKLAKPFEKFADYLLGGKSNPHITLAQFYLDDSHDVGEIWMQVQKKSNYTKDMLPVRLNKTHVKQEGDIIWLALLLDADANPACHALHNEIADLLQSNDIECLNACRDKYAPHMTLARTKDLSKIEVFSNYKIDIQDNYYLALGKSDNIGQLVEVLQTLVHE